MKSIRKQFGVSFKHLIKGTGLLLLLTFIYTVPTKAQDCQEDYEQCMLKQLEILAAQVARAERKYQFCLIGNSEEYCKEKKAKAIKEALEAYEIFTKLCESQLRKCLSYGVQG